MYTVLGGIYGALLSVMNLFNAQLSAVYGNWGSTVMIHAVGLLVLLPLAFTWGRPKGHAPWYLYGGGLIGIVTVTCCNLAIGGIGVTANLVIMLLGQLTCSTLIDQFGLFGARQVKLSAARLVSLLVIAAGDLVMLLWAGSSAGEGNASTLLAVLTSFLSGFSMVFARISNARLAEKSGLGFSTVMNYVTGLAGSFLIFACMGLHLETAFPAPGQSITIYLGGAMGALAIFLCNMVTPKLSTLQFTVILFVGQIFASMLLDALLLGTFSMGTLIGGLIVAVGMALNTRAEAKEAKLLGDAHQS